MYYEEDYNFDENYDSNEEFDFEGELDEDFEDEHEEDYEGEQVEDYDYFEDPVEEALNRYAEQDYERDTFYALTDGSCGEFDDYDESGREHLFDGLGY